MQKAERIYRIKARLDSGQSIGRASLLRELEVSESTLKRDLAELRYAFNVPIEWVEQPPGWRLRSQGQTQAMQFELPGLWFTADEAVALLTLQQMLSSLDPAGLLAAHLEPLKQRLAKLTRESIIDGTEFSKRVKVLTLAARRVELPHFQLFASALLRRKRVFIAYHARGTNEPSQRELSPQRLIHYRDNWYLDAWCHLRKALRSFSVDAVKQAQTLNKAAIDISEHRLDLTLGAGYGIFAGQQVSWATLRFSAERSRWVAAEAWHPQQRGRYDEQGRWVLQLPYADATELAMDILRHVPEVEVLAPASLKKLVEDKLRTGLARVSG